jgi:hypothetical protein
LRGADSSDFIIVMSQQVLLGRTRRVGILLICCTSLFIVGLDITAVNVALPSLGHASAPASPACSGRSTRTRSCWRAC